MENWSHMLHVKCNTSCFRCHMSIILCCMSPVTCHLSHDTCHMSPVTCHPSHVTCYISVLLTPNSPTLLSMVNEHSQTKVSPFLFLNCSTYSTNYAIFISFKYKFPIFLLLSKSILWLEAQLYPFLVRRLTKKIEAKSNLFSKIAVTF